ncbi:MAG: tRNA dimethylallyltransferase [Candidatus Peregrinibacteria bacterium Gr01-1014_25]|nr:MAG: tRNA dimethylallyltransferase [Candidatus Peregrinibacteria bacterium Gr01-1014_25]
MTVESWQRLVERHLVSSRNPLIVILGPTASGKTAFSLRVCEQIRNGSHGWCGAEVVNADSRQLFRHLDIGTAKIAASEMQGIPHHLIDVRDPREPVSVGWYQEQATAAIDDILKRQSVPVLVGGSMLYISAIVDGLKPLPPADPALRKRLSGEYDRDGGASLLRRLASLDPESARAIDQRNKVYLVRAMELCESAGMPASRQKVTAQAPYDLLMLGMDWPRAELHHRINERTHQLFAAGWVEEVEGLLRRGYGADDPGMISHGYREIANAMVDGRWQMTAEDANALASAVAAKTRQYAKRQMTWWRNDARISWVKG